MSMTYTTYFQRLMELSGFGSQTINFPAVIPTVIDMAEQRIYREMDLLGTVVRDSSSNLTANSRDFILPTPATGRFVVVNQVNVLTPVGTTIANGSINPLVPVSMDFLQMVWPSQTAPSATSVPEYFAMVTDQTMIVGPAPGAAYNIQIVGEIRPNPLSAINASTYLTLYLPDLFLAASMVNLAMYGTQGGANAAQAAAWEQAYQTHKASADIEEHRKRFAGASWTSQPISPIALPQRG
jgi:hypothetical protein